MPKDKALLEKTLEKIIEDKLRGTGFYLSTPIMLGVGDHDKVKDWYNFYSSAVDVQGGGTNGLDHWK